VVVAMASYQQPRIPEVSRQLRSDILQLHSSACQNPSQLREGPVLVVGAGNSGAEIALELARSGRKVWLTGRDTGEVPFRIASFWGRWLFAPLRPIERRLIMRSTIVLRFVFHRLLTIKTAMGRKARLKMLSSGAPLIRTRQVDLSRVGVERCARLVNAALGLPTLEDGRVLEVSNVIWCTGYHPGFSWIELPIFDAMREPRHVAGVVADAPGLYFVGLHFLYSLSSTMIHGVGRDAARIVETLLRRARVSATLPAASRSQFTSGDWHYIASSWHEQIAIGTSSHRPPQAARKTGATGAVCLAGKAVAKAWALGPGSRELAEFAGVHGVRKSPTRKKAGAASRLGPRGRCRCHSDICGRYSGQESA
jgi:Pyridine nucleotide-disulphide oxidoreductase